MIRQSFRGRYIAFFRPIHKAHLLKHKHNITSPISLLSAPAFHVATVHANSCTHFPLALYVRAFFLYPSV